MYGQKRRVVRDDGKEYESLSAAWRAMLDEMIERDGLHYTPERYKSLAAQIGRDIGCCLRGQARSARGHKWREAESVSSDDMLTLISDMWGVITGIPVPTQQLGTIPERVRRAIYGKEGDMPELRTIRNMQMPDKTWRRFKDMAFARGFTVAQAAAQAILEWMEKRGETEE